MAVTGGNTSYFMLGGTSYPFGKWGYSFAGGTKTYHVFGNDGFQMTVPGGKGVTVTAEGPYDAGNMPLTGGAVYECHLGVDDGIELVVSARLDGIEYSTEVSADGDPSMCSITLLSHGTFTLSLS